MASLGARMGTNFVEAFKDSSLMHMLCLLDTGTKSPLTIAILDELVS